jgi:hypothetical protein
MKLQTKSGLLVDSECKNGKHVYLYIAPAGSTSPENPEGMPCQCGKERYRRKKQAPLQADRKQSDRQM